LVLRKIAGLFRRQRPTDLSEFRGLFGRFQQILRGNNRVLEIISELEDKLGGEYIFDINYLKDAAEQLSNAVYIVCSSLNVIAANKYRELLSRQIAINEEITSILEGQPHVKDGGLVIEFDSTDSDMASLVGGKNANLGEIKNYLQLLTPDGFIISTNSYRSFMAQNNLWPEIRKIREAYLTKDHDAEEYDRAIDELFAKSRVPSEVARAINNNWEKLQRKYQQKIGLAVRSSAFGEDVPGRTFAGQFVTILSCRGNELLDAYTKVLASRFKHRLFEYAGEIVFQEKALPMAVGVLAMIEARTAGVAYSIDPSAEFPDSLSISAVFGLGTEVVGGTAEVDLLYISRLDPTQIESQKIGRKTHLIAAGEAAGISKFPVSDDLQNAACLNNDQVTDLAERVLMLERYFKRPVDVEWCIGKDDRLYILQCRPLRLPPLAPRQVTGRLTDLADKPVIMKRQGQVAQRGIAAGRIRQVHEDDDPGDFPIGGIAVTRYTTPRLTSIIRKASAIITDIGSPTGHMATVAREFGVPMIVNTGDATEKLANGTEVTIDAEENVIYAGIVKELLAYKLEGEDVYRDLPEYHMLRQILRRISPLNMIDPTSAEFNAKNCRTYHDIVRFSHEMAVKFLINLNISSRHFRGVKSQELKLPIPLGLHLIDLGGGLPPGIRGIKITSVDDVLSKPMHAIIAGLIAPGVWSTSPMQLGFGDLVSSLTRYSMADRGAVYRGQNLAVISDHYANISLRLGYHFNVIDTYVSENVDDNYIYFRFVGGVTETERRHLRAILIKDILEKLNFLVTLRGDLVVARLKKLAEKDALEVLQEIGRLIGFTRQLDTQMQSEQSVAEGLKAFFKHPDQSE